jgi:hypothetical protein
MTWLFPGVTGDKIITIDYKRYPKFLKSSNRENRFEITKLNSICSPDSSDRCAKIVEHKINQIDYPSMSIAHPIAFITPYYKKDDSLGELIAYIFDGQKLIPVYRK